jgi:hypothetical protein
MTTVFDNSESFMSTVVDNNGGCLMAETGRFALKHLHAARGHYWIMHPVQVAQIASLFVAKIVDSEQEDIVITEVDGPYCHHTFCGIRLKQDEHFPMDRMELRDINHSVLVVVKNLAVPDAQRKSDSRREEHGL